MCSQSSTTSEASVLFFRQHPRSVLAVPAAHAAAPRLVNVRLLDWFEIRVHRDLWSTDQPGPVQILCRGDFSYRVFKLGVNARYMICWQVRKCRGLGADPMGCGRYTVEYAVMPSSGRKREQYTARTSPGPGHSL